MARDGWVKLWRTLIDNPMWLEKPFSKGQAWVDLILLTQSQNHENVDRYGNLVKYERGKIYMSTVQLSERWGWSRGRVLRFLENLEKAHMITRKSGTGFGTVITVENWDKYQDRRTGNGTRDDTRDDTTRGQEAVHNKEGKEGIRRKEAADAPPLDAGWSPPKKGTPEYERWRNQ